MFWFHSTSIWHRFRKRFLLLSDEINRLGANLSCIQLHSSMFNVYDLNRRNLRVWFANWSHRWNSMRPLRIIRSRMDASFAEPTILITNRFSSIFDCLYECLRWWFLHNSAYENSNAPKHKQQFWSFILICSVSSMNRDLPY